MSKATSAVRATASSARLKRRRFWDCGAWVSGSGGFESPSRDPAHLGGFLRCMLSCASKVLKGFSLLSPYTFLILLSWDASFNCACEEANRDELPAQASLEEIGEAG